ncbi:unnamed protein product [Absidia cylindrospora]
MEAYGLSQTESLLKDLSSETLTTEYYSLKAKYDDLFKREQESRNELERTQTLLEESQKTAAVNQREKEAVESKMVDITNNKHESVSLVSDLRQSLALLRSENAKLSQENKEKYMKNIMIQTDKDAEHYQNETLKVQVNDLHLRLNNLIKNEERTRQALLAAESEIRLQNQSKQREREHYISQKNFLENERDSLSATVHELRQELAKLKTDMECANERARTAEERHQKLETNRIATKKNHNDLIAIYEKQRLEAEEKIANFSADLKIIQQKATSDQAKLQQDNKALQDQLTEALDRIQVTRNSLDQLLDEKSSPDTTPTACSSDTIVTSPILGGNLLKMMKQYESTGRHWDDIYSDFFQLRDTTTRLTAINDELTTVNKQLIRERDSQQQYHDRLESELDQLRSECATQGSATETLEKLKSSTSQQISELKEEVGKLEHTKEDLEASLSDTTYQLRYLLRHVESQYGTLPEEVQETSDLLGSACIPPTLSHEQTIFKDISDLQMRNQELMTEVRHLSTQLKEKTAEVDSYATQVKENRSLLTDSSSKSASLIRDQNEKLQVLESRLSKVTTEREQLLKQLPNSTLPSIASSSSGGAQEDQKLAEQKYHELLGEFEAYKQEMEPELHNLQERIQSMSTEAMVSQRNYNRSMVEINELRQRNIGVLQVSNSRQTEIDDLRRRATAREGHIGDLESRVLSFNNEIMNITRQVENLRTENSSITAQLNASDASYQRLLIENKELANERMNLTTLLQNMNDSLGSSTSGTTHLVEELKQHNERLSRELQHIRDTLASKEKELRGYQAIDQREWKDKYQTTSGELKQLKTTYLELEKQLATANQDRIIAQTKLMETLQNTQGPTGDGGADTAGSTRNTPSNETLSDQSKQLTDANNQVVSLKKDLFDFKERLADADATVNRITQEYNTFATESQIRIDKLSDDLAASNQKVDNMQVDLENILNEQKETKAVHSRDEQQWESTKAALVQENDQLQSKVVTLSSQITELQAELDTNVQHLQQSEERYQAEMSSRAQDADTIATLRDEVNRLNMDISTSKSEVLGAQERIRSAELSYRNQREQLETTQNDMKLRLEESQKQQESLSTTIQELLSKINELRTTPDSVDSELMTNLAENATQQLRDVSASLRREKDIWQARYSDAQQRVNRVESDLEFVQHQLSTTRALLEAVRAEKEDTAKKQQQGIKDARTDAALYKESNASLRNNVEQLKDRVAQLESLISTKEAEVEPLTLKAQGLEHELKQTKELVQTLETKQVAWTARSNLLLSKHNKTDPEELERLKAELETAKAQVEEKTNLLEALEKKYQDLVTQSSQTEEQLKKASDLANHRGKLALDYRKKVSDLESTIKTQKEQHTEQQKEQQKEQEKSDVSDKIKELEEALKKQKDDHSAQSTKYNNLLNKARQLNAEKRALTVEVEPLKQAKADLTAQLEAIKTEMEQIKQQLTMKTEEASSLQVEINRMKAMQSMTTNKNEKLKKEVTALQQKLKGSTSSPHPQNDKSDKKSTAGTTTLQPTPTTTETPPTTTIPSPSSPAAATTLTATAPVFTPASTPPTAVVSSPLASQESSSPKNGDESATTATPASKTNETTEANTLKRAPEDDLDGQSPAKK